MSPAQLSAVTDAITAHQDALVAIGAAVLGLIYVVRVFAWGRKV